MIYRFKIEIKARTKKNHRPIFRNKKTGQVFLGKDKSLTEYENACHLILSAQKNIQGIIEPIKQRVIGSYVFEFKGKCTADLDNLIAGVQDPLQKAGIVLNDKQINEIHARIKEDTGKDQILIELRVSGTEEQVGIADFIRELIKE